MRKVSIDYVAAGSAGLSGMALLLFLLAQDARFGAYLVLISLVGMFVIYFVRARRAEAEAAELRAALEGVLPFMEEAEAAGLVGHEGCMWPVENVRAALAGDQA